MSISEPPTTAARRRLFHASVAVLVLVVVAFTVWGDGLKPDDLNDAGPTVPGPLVLVVSVDGLHPAAITTLGRNGAPAFHRLMDEGTWTLNARTAYEITKTLPNHTGMLTGRSVGGPAGHRVSFNNDNGKTLATTNGRYVPGVFDVAHDRGLQTAFFAEKDKFNYLIRSWDETNGALDTTGEDEGRDKTDLDEVAPLSELIPRTIAAMSDGRTDLIFLHMQAPDKAGHADGWFSEEYLEAVRSVDANLGRILDRSQRDPSIRSRLTILLTSDHGGEPGEKTHYDVADIANFRIPFMAWGAGVAKGADLYAINPGRSDPGNERPTYTGRQPVRNLDVANTALRLLGLGPIGGAVSTTWSPLSLSRQ